MKDEQDLCEDFCFTKNKTEGHTRWQWLLLCLNAIARMLLVAEIYFQLTTWRQRSVIQDPVLALVGPESSDTHSQGQGLQTYTKYSIGKLNCFL